MADIGLQNVVEWICGAGISASVGSVAGWLGANLRIGTKLAALRTELVALIGTVQTRNLSELTKLEVALREDIAKLETAIEELSGNNVEERVKSAGNHAEAAQLAKQLEEVKAQGQRTNDSLQRMIGLLQSKGVRI